MNYIRFKEFKKKRPTFPFTFERNINKRMGAYKSVKVPIVKVYQSWHIDDGTIVNENVSSAVLSASSVVFIESGRMQDGSRGPTAARQLIRFLGRGPVNLPTAVL